MARIHLTHWVVQCAAVRSVASPKRWLKPLGFRGEDAKKRLVPWRGVYRDFLMDLPLPRLRLRLGRFGSTRTGFLFDMCTYCSNEFYLVSW